MPGGYGLGSIRLAQPVLDTIAGRWTPTTLAGHGGASVATASRFLKRLHDLGLASVVAEGRERVYDDVRLALLADYLGAELDPVKRRERTPVRLSAGTVTGGADSEDRSSNCAGAHRDCHHRRRCHPGRHAGRDRDPGRLGSSPPQRRPRKRSGCARPRQGDADLRHPARTVAALAPRAARRSLTVSAGKFAPRGTRSRVEAAAAATERGRSPEIAQTWPVRAMYLGSRLHTMTGSHIPDSHPPRSLACALPIG